jgi:hypothetical protein
MDRRTFMKLGALAVGAPSVLVDRHALAARIDPDSFRPVAAREYPIRQTMRAEVLRRDEYVSVGSYENLYVGDVWRARMPNGLIADAGTEHELSVVIEPPKLFEAKTGGFRTWSVLCERWDEFARPLREIPWDRLDGRLNAVYLGSGTPVSSGLRYSWPKLYLYSPLFKRTSSREALWLYELAWAAQAKAIAALRAAYPKLTWDEDALFPMKPNKLGLVVACVDHLDGSEQYNMPQALDPSPVVQQVWRPGLHVTEYVDPGVYIADVIPPKEV